ncbi:GNAT family N-acetyltransferase [Novosphingobium sp. LASN5T]|nr:GNAT family N-acetyltransferase [Novosphingobium sp. LASN5T]
MIEALVRTTGSAPNGGQAAFAVSHAKSGYMCPQKHHGLGPLTMLERVWSEEPVVVELPEAIPSFEAYPDRRGSMFAAVSGFCKFGAIYVGEIVDDPGCTFASFELAVHEEWRNQGWGTRLVSRAEAWAASSGFSGMMISVQPDNAAALALYRRLAYRLTWYERNRNQSAGSMHVLVKTLYPASPTKSRYRHA